MSRRTSGDETWYRLKNWTKASKDAERLASQTLKYEGYKSLDPSHPHGGPDQGKDIVGYKNNKTFLIAVTFSKNELSWAKLKNKFCQDLEKIKDQKGFIFFTNQEITVAKREKLKNIKDGIDIDIYHLERISQILDSPPCYGLRLEFLDIDMNKEEQISFISSRDMILREINNKINEFIQGSKNNFPTEDLREFQNILNQITGFSSASHMVTAGNQRGNISKLKVPIDELKEFAKILRSITVTDTYAGAHFLSPNVHKLKVPLDDLKKYEDTLDRILIKQRSLDIKKSDED